MTSMGEGNSLLSNQIMETVLLRHMVLCNLFEFIKIKLLFGCCLLELRPSSQGVIQTHLSTAGNSF